MSWFTYTEVGLSRAQTDTVSGSWNSFLFKNLLLILVSLQKSKVLRSSWRKMWWWSPSIIGNGPNRFNLINWLFSRNLSFLDLVLWDSCPLMILMWEETTVFETKSWPWYGSRQTSRTLEETLARSRYLEVVASGSTSFHPCPRAFSTGLYKDPIIKTIICQACFLNVRAIIQSGPPLSFGGKIQVWSGVVTNYSVFSAWDFHA